MTNAVKITSGLSNIFSFPRLNAFLRTPCPARPVHGRMQWVVPSRTGALLLTHVPPEVIVRRRHAPVPIAHWLRWPHLPAMH